MAEVLTCLSEFVNDFNSRLSREDLIHLDYGLDRVYSFLKIRPKTTDENFRRAEQLLKRIRFQKQEAPSKRETSATPHVMRIFSALHPGMTFEEVKVEFARIVAPLIRKKLTERKKAAPPEEVGRFVFGGVGPGPRRKH